MTTQTYKNINPVYANTNKQHLPEHLFAVGYLASQIISLSIPDDKKLQESTFISGGVHDIGKIEPVYSKWVKGNLSAIFSEIPEDGEHIDKSSLFEKHPRHNEISYLLFTLQAESDRLNSENITRIKHTIFWHHAKPMRKNDYHDAATIYSMLSKNIGEKTINSLLTLASEIINSVNSISKKYECPYELPSFSIKQSEEIFNLLDGVKLPEYKQYNERSSFADYKRTILKNAKNDLMRAAVISADRIVSALKSDELSHFINNKSLNTLIENIHDNKTYLRKHIEKCIIDFDKKYPNSNRNIQQSEAAKKLSLAVNISVLSGPAGCGKTKIALEWAKLSGANRIIWVCPRVHICMGLLNDLTSKEYLPETVIEINTGEFKHLVKNGKKELLDDSNQFSGDIVITTIDQIINTITTHKRITALNQFMNSHVVFDEFHELINLPGFNLLFMELIECKKLKGKNANTLLISATPHLLFIKDILGIDNEDVIGIESFNVNPYSIKVVEYEEEKIDDSNPFYLKQSKNTFVISNTATTAQISFLVNQKNEKSLLLHSKFTKNDKDKLFDNAYRSFRLGGTNEYDVLRSGPIVQASLNITCSSMISEFTTAENFLQRLGRLDRFAESHAENSYVYAIPANIIKGKAKSKCGRFLSSQNCYHSSIKWYQFIKDKIKSKSVTIKELYSIYNDFYADKSSAETVKEDLLKSFKTGVELINTKILDPVSFPYVKKSEIKIKKNSLRGENRFVQMAICSVSSSLDIKFENLYTADEKDSDNFLTAPLYEICGNGNSRNNLLSFMAKKHHNIKQVKKAFNDNILLNNARKQISPIYLSYTPEDLDKVDAHPHPNAIYYVLSEKQPVGCLDISKLNFKGE
ncbi:DEAD/DEAH box helicase [Seleniivibrio woodruffii]|uniref:DEAD/DEAH box helicase n=1 Tax=Seleniivibrio woodruffii TaxID=1078050 RepID=UPI00240900A1|nr:DEAD/DEAH box helicase [Seleniivibrio woodruffii]